MTCKEYKDSSGYGGSCENCSRSRITHDKASLQAWFDLQANLGRPTLDPLEAQQCVAAPRPIYPEALSLGPIEFKPMANESQVGGSHYKNVTRSGQQHWDMAWDFRLDFFQYQITKYLFRWRDKHGLEDLEKAKHFLDKYLEIARETGPETAIRQFVIQQHAQEQTRAGIVGSILGGQTREGVARG